MAVKVVGLEELLHDKESQLRGLGSAGKEWLEEARVLRQAVTSTLDALGLSEPLLHAQPGLGSAL